MPVDPAEIVRTLAAGHRPAHPHVPGHAEAPPVPAIADPTGAPVLLLADDSPISCGFRNSDPSVAVRYDDQPPVPNAPWLGSGWICGWAEPVCAHDQLALSVAFADHHPVTKLLGIGDTHSLWRVEPAEVRLENDEGLVEIDIDSYMSATADAWHQWETDLIMDLTVHHPDVLDALLHRIQHQLPQARHLNPLRMDRYGTVVDVHCDDESRRFLVRHRPGVESPSDVLHSLACCTCPHN